MDEEYTDDMICDACRFFVIDARKKTFGRCFFNPPTPIVRKQKDQQGRERESVKTTRVIVYPTDFCGHYEDVDDDPRRDIAAHRGNNKGD